MLLTSELIRNKKMDRRTKVESVLYSLEFRAPPTLWHTMGGGWGWRKVKRYYLRRICSCFQRTKIWLPIPGSLIQLTHAASTSSAYGDENTHSIAYMSVPRKKTFSHGPSVSLCTVFKKFGQWSCFLYCNVKRIFLCVSH